MLKIHDGQKETKETVKKNKHSENILTRQLTRINSELSESISFIDNKVKRIHKEQNPPEHEPYYLRRRCSVEHQSDVHPKHVSPTRFRSSSFGNKVSKIKNSISPSVSQESVSSTGSTGGKSTERSVSSSRDSSPSRKLTNRSNTSISEVIQATRYGGRRMSLPMSFRPHISSAGNVRMSRENTMDTALTSENISTRLRRVQIDLHHRVPKSIRQLRKNSMTTAEEISERLSEEEELRKLQSNEATDKFVSELEKCTYLRSSPQKDILTVEDIFHWLFLILLNKLCTKFHARC